MDQSITHVVLVVNDYDEAIQFFTRKLKFELIEDTHVPEQDKRWVLVDDFWRDYEDMVAGGVKIVRAPRVEAYGVVAVFEDLYGNLWDLLGPKNIRAGTAALDDAGGSAAMNESEEDSARRRSHE